jgi:lipopolysaccharide assembly outer membrane protein LptD (OstA)
MIEFFNIKDYRLSEKGVELEARASKAQRFDDMDILYDIDALMIDDNKTKTLNANNATFKNNIVYLAGDVRYIDNSMILTTEAAEYRQKENRLLGTAPFKLEDKGAIARGGSFVYDIAQGTIEASNINAVIETRKK